MLSFKEQNCDFTLGEGIKEYNEYLVLNDKEVLPQLKDSSIVMDHDATHVIFGLDTSIEQESILDTYVIWGMKFNWGKIINFYKDPEYKEVIGDIVQKHGGYWGIFKIYMSLMPIKLRVFFRCMKMKKKWNYHDISDEMLSAKLCDLREEYNIELLPLKYIPINRYNSKSL